jgi:hypothetical protein
MSALGFVFLGVFPKPDVYLLKTMNHIGFLRQYQQGLFLMKLINTGLVIDTAWESCLVRLFIN